MRAFKDMPVMNSTTRHTLRGYVLLAVLVLIVAGVGLWAGSFPSRFY